MRASAAPVGQPVTQALEKTGGRGPARFLLSDNGAQYISDESIQRRIPACVPQYNGTVEGGMREFESVFYEVWERWKPENADQEKEPIARFQRDTRADPADRGQRPP